MARNDKIKCLEELAGVTTAKRAEHKTVVHCHGYFDILHIAAIRHLEEAKKLADVLVVTLAPDESASASARHVFRQDLRAEAVAALACVDYVAVGKSNHPSEAIQLVRPDVFVPADADADEEDDSTASPGATTEDAILRALGVRVVQIKNSGLKSAAWKHQYSPAFPAESSGFLGPFCSRYSAEAVCERLQQVRSLRVLFLGEAIIDEYQYCETMGKSGKEPVLAVRYLSTEKFAGGIMATANQAAAFSDHVGMISLLGTRDSHEEFIREKLNPKIDAMFLYMPGSRTIVKRRLVEIYPFQKLFEVYFMDPEVPDTASKALHARLKAVLPSYDAVVVTDYGHGMMTPEIVDLLCGQDRFLVINTQTNAANQGFNSPSKYSRADFLCLSEKELRLEARNRSKDLRLIIAETSKKLACRRILVTRGREGCLGYDANEGFFAVPSFTNRIVDRVGAGDAVLAVASLCAAQDAPMELLGFVGNAVGAQAVATVGNRSVVSSSALLKQIDSLLNYDHWISTP